MARYLFGGCYVAAVIYLCAVALSPGLRNSAPLWFEWFGGYGSVQTMAAVLAFPATLLVLSRLAGRRILRSIPLVVLAAMAVSAFALGMSSYWNCYGEQSPIFAPLSWTLSLFFGQMEDPFHPPLPGEDTANRCAVREMPVALELARLLAIATTSAAGVVIALTLFRSQLDRIAIWRARSLIVAVDVDDATISMLHAISHRMASAETLVVLTTDENRRSVAEARELGAKVRVVALDDAKAIARLRLWKRLDRLYLLASDPVQNETRLQAINTAMDAFRDRRVRLPLTVRVDDPWQAEVWRRGFLQHEDTAYSMEVRFNRWVADAVGRYEITAAKVVRHLTHKSEEWPTPETVLICGLSPLTYALSSEFAQLQREQRLYNSPSVGLPSRLIIVAARAKGFVDDHLLRQQLITLNEPMLSVEAFDAEPDVDTITTYLNGKDQRRFAVLLANPATEIEGTRLASRFPDLKVYMASTSAAALADSSIIGQLYAFPIDMELGQDAPQDTWERAAELIHEHYSVGRDRTLPTARPWMELDPFVKQSNRRQVINTLWLVETEGKHTWNTLARPPAPPLSDNFDTLNPHLQLSELGFDEETAEKMIIKEHEDWCRFHWAARWKYSDEYSFESRRHPRLKPWAELIAEDSNNRVIAQRSLVSTLVNLRILGFRSVPKAAGRSRESM